MDILHTTIVKQSDYIKQLLKKNKQLEKELEEVKFERDILQSMNIVNEHYIDVMKRERNEIERNMERYSSIWRTVSSV